MPDEILRYNRFEDFDLMTSVMPCYSCRSTDLQSPGEEGQHTGVSFSHDITPGRQNQGQNRLSYVK